MPANCFFYCTLVGSTCVPCCQLYEQEFQTIYADKIFNYLFFNRENDEELGVGEVDDRVRLYMWY